MLCPSCGESISDYSVFCMFCSVRVDILRVDAVPDPHVPAKIGRVQFYFDGKVRAAPNGTRKRPDVLRDGFCVDFQLLDDQGRPMACSGTADLNLKVTQAIKTQPLSPTILLKTRASVKVKETSFQHDPAGQPYYHLICSAPVLLRTRGAFLPTCDIGIKVVAAGGREPLYLLTQASADPGERTNLVTHVLEPDHATVTTWLAGLA